MQHTKKNKGPLVSIIIPSYNRVFLITETLNSILAQTYEHFECIIVDDGSSDGTIESVKIFTERDNRFLCSQRVREPKGASVCRNIGAEMAKGEYLIFLDSDDLLDSGCLEKRIEFIAQYPKRDFWVFRTKLFYNVCGDSSLFFNSSKNVESLERFLNLDIPWQTSSVLWRKSTFISLNGFDENALSWQDWDLHVRALATELSFKIFSSTDHDNFYRVGHGQTIGKASSSHVHLLSQFEVFKKNADLIRFKSNANRKSELANSISSLAWYFSIRLFKAKDKKKAFSCLQYLYKAQWLSFGHYAVLKLLLWRYKKSGGSIFKKINETFWPGSLSAIDTTTWLKSKC